MTNAARLLIFTILIVACGAVPTAAPAGRSGEGVNLVVDVQGNLSLKRRGWSEYAPALFGMAVHNGDLLRLEGTSQATVACSDLTLAKAAGGVNSVPCKVTRPVLVYGDSLIIPTRADTPSDIPIAISPRKTRLLNAYPTLRWSSVPGANSYKITVRCPNLTWSTDVSGKTELVYPNSAPALQPGATYKLTVQANNRSSDEEQGAGLGFTMLKPEEAQAVRGSEARIRNLGLAEPATRLLMANLYASQGLNAEAIDQLQELAKAAQEPAVLRSLGDLYLKVGLNRLAEGTYIQALDLSQKANDIEGQAAANNALALVYEALGNNAEAIQRSQKALGWYQKLGDSNTAKQIQDRLASLQKP